MVEKDEKFNSIENRKKEFTDTLNVNSFYDINFSDMNIASIHNLTSLIDELKDLVKNNSNDKNLKVIEKINKVFQDSMEKFYNFMDNSEEHFSIIYNWNARFLIPICFANPESNEFKKANEDLFKVALEHTETNELMNNDIVKIHVFLYYIMTSLSNLSFFLIEFIKVCGIDLTKYSYAKMSASIILKIIKLLDINLEFKEIKTIFYDTHEGFSFNIDYLSPNESKIDHLKKIFINDKRKFNIDESGFQINILELFINGIFDENPEVKRLVDYVILSSDSESSSESESISGSEVHDSVSKKKNKPPITKAMKDDSDSYSSEESPANDSYSEDEYS